MRLSITEGLEPGSLEGSTALLKVALRAAQAGSWAWDLTTKEIFWSDEYHHLIGTDPATLQPSYEAWLEKVHPDDRKPAAEQMQAALDNQRDINIEVRIIRPDGLRWMLSQGQILYGEQGQPLKMIGVTFDVTDRKRAEEALRDSEERFRKAVENMLDCLGIYTAVRDADGTIVDFRIEYVNAAACTNNKMVSEEQVGKLLCEILPGHRESGLFAEYCDVVETGQPLIKETLIYEDDYPGRRLKRSFDIRAVKLGDGFMAVWRDVTERKQIEQALQETDRRKDEFLAMLAHELRNPLAPIRNAVQVMRHFGLGDPQLERMRAVIERQTDQLTRMVDDLLDISRISQGKITLRKEKVDLLTIVGHAVETSRPLIDGSGHRLTVSLPSESLRIEGDVTRLAQVLSNLLNNAAKYTEAGGEIWLTAERQGDEVELRVKDSGIGMSPDVLPRIFDLFAQADRALDRSQGGLGIGLTLVRSLVEMHGGKVKAFSEGLGKGSEITVRLPLLIVRPHPAAEPAERSGRPGTTAPLVGCRILLVDDNVDNVQSLSLLLALEGHEVRTAHDGREGIETARDFQPQVVVLDIGLPQMSGYEVAVHLREQLTLHGALLIALTGYGQPEDRQRSKDAGFDHHLVKPVDFDALRNLIATHAGCA
jgi:PAS domain S-box-containing protein